MSYFKNAKLSKRINSPFAKNIPFTFKLFTGAMMTSHVTFYSVVFSAGLNILDDIKKSL
jgi:hypothetical protein